MSPRQPRRIVESDDESLPETWEEMRRNCEPVSPASEQQQETVHRIDHPRVITIEDDDDELSQQAPLGDEPPFEVLISMMDDAPPEPAPEPVNNRPESPQPGPSGRQEIRGHDDSNDDEKMDELLCKRIDDSVGTITQDTKEYDKAERVIDKATNGLHIVRMMMDQCKDTVFLLHDYKEAYRTSRRAQKRKIEECDDLKSQVQSEAKKVKDELDAHAKQTNEAYEANAIVLRQIETLNSEARDYIEQRHQTEHIVDQLKAKLAQEKTKVYNLKKYNAALKGAMEDKDKTIGRLETELNQTRQHLHHFTGITVPRRPSSYSASAQADESSSSSSEEEDT